MSSYIQEFSQVIWAGTTLWPGVYTATTNGQAVDLGPADGNLLTLDVAVGNVSGTSPTLTCVIQASADGSNWVDIFTLPAITSGNQRFRQPVPLPPPSSDTPAWRQVRVRAILGGTSPQFSVHAVFLALARHPQPEKGALFQPPVLS